MSAKTTTQPGRRTPLSLTGAVSKGQPNKGGSNAATNNGNNANGHTTTNNNKQDNKLQQQKTEQQKSNNSDIKENSNNKKVQQQQSDKKQQQQQQNDNKKSIEKNQNCANNSKQQQQQTHENKQNLQQNKEGKQQNGNNKLNENDKKENKDKPEKLEIKSKDCTKSEPEIQKNNKQDEKKIKEVKLDTKEENMVDINDTVNKANEKAQNSLPEKKDDKKVKVEKVIEVANQKSVEEKTKEKEITEEHQQLQQKSPPATPKTNRANKTLSPLKTPTEKTPQKSTTLNSEIKTTPITRREITTTIDDVEMEPLTVESSPIKPRQSQEVANINIAPSATSTPGKIVLPKRSLAVPKSDVQLAMQPGYSPERPRAFSQISGRKSIRPITDYTPSKFQSNPQFRESYRRINTELDATNTSMNVTVGSEVPNNLSFSFFGRGRKRDRTPPHHSQSAIGELHTDMEASPPKKARFEGFFSVVSSPLTLLRNRFSKATLQSSTPVKLEDKLNVAEDEIEVQNVSGISIHEELSKKEIEIGTAPNKDTILDEEVRKAKSNSAGEEDLEDKDVFSKNENACGLEKNNEQLDIKITDTPLQVAGDDPLAKNKRCIVM